MTYLISVPKMWWLDYNQHVIKYFERFSKVVRFESKSEIHFSIRWTEDCDLSCIEIKIEKNEVKFCKKMVA